MMNMKNHFFGEGEISVEQLADYASQNIYFTGKNKSDSYPTYDDVVKGTGVIVFWDQK